MNLEGLELDHESFPVAKLPLVNSHISPLPPTMWDVEQFSPVSSPPPPSSDDSDGQQWQVEADWQLRPLQTNPLVPRLYLPHPNVITVVLGHNVLVNLTTSRNIRLYQVNSIALSSARNGFGKLCAVHHPNFGYVQDDCQMFAKLPTGHCITGDVGQMKLFHPTPADPEGVWVLSSLGVELSPHHPSIDFPSNDVDVTMEVFYHGCHSTGDETEAAEQLDKSRWQRHQNHLEVIVNGIRINQRLDSGIVTVEDRDSRKLELNPSSSSGTISGPSGRVRLTPEGAAEVRLHNHHFVATADEIRMTVGNRTALFNSQMWMEPNVQ